MKHLVPFLAISASLVVSGCYHPGHADTRTTYHAPTSQHVVQTTPRYVTVQQAPPAVQASVTQGPKPSQTSAWIDGYWSQQNGRWVWIPGHWEEPRQNGHVWQPPVCVQDNNNGYRYYPGYWHGRQDRVDPAYRRTDGPPVYARPARRAGPYVQQRPQRAPVQDVLVRPGSRRPNRGTTTVRPGTQPSEPVYTQPSRPSRGGGTVTVRPSEPRRPNGTVTRPRTSPSGTVTVRPGRPSEPARPSGTVSGRPTRPSGTVSGGATQPSRPAVRVRPRAPNTEPSPAGAVTVSPTRPSGTVRPSATAVRPSQPAGTVRPGTVVVAPSQRPGTARPGTVVHTPSQTPGAVRPGTVVHTPSQTPGTVRPVRPGGTLQPSGVRPGTVAPGGVVVGERRNPQVEPARPSQPTMPVCRLATNVAPRGGILTITGRNFDRSLTVRIGGNFGSTVGVSPMRVTVQVPRNSRGGAVVIEQGGHTVTCGSLRTIGR